MAAPLNVVLLIADGHGHYTGDLDWGTEEFRGLRTRLERLRLGERGFAKFNNVISPAVSTIMSIESMLTGLLAAKTHKLHWREWPAWDRLEHPQLSTFLQGRGYDVHGFSYLLNAENWMPGILCYKPELYRDFPSHKRDTHSHHAVLAAAKHYFAHDFKAGRPQFLMVHSIFVFDFWDELMALFAQHGLTDANTIFAFTSDHYFPRNFGRQWLLGERDGTPIYHHTDLTEYNTRVFLYLKYPGLRPREIGDVVSGCDVAPTLVDLLGLQAEWPGKFDGESLRPRLEHPGVPPALRTIRSDNVYPYQIGEKQGRISAVRRGRYKYVFRPDPASSYIAYRLHEPWSRVLGHEEFYDIEADPEEQQNLVTTVDASQRAELERCRMEMRRTSEAIMDYHLEGLHNFALSQGLAGALSGGAPAGRILCFQTCAAEVCVTLVRLIVALHPTAVVFLVARDLGGFALPERCRVLAYPGAAYELGGVRALLGAEIERGFDAMLRTSNYPVGAGASVYDPAAHPLADFAAAGAVIRALGGARAFTLGLDCSLVPIGASDAAGAAGIGATLRRRLVEAPARWLLEKLKPRLRRWMKPLEAGGARMQPHFSERIIRDKTRE